MRLATAALAAFAVLASTTVAVAQQSSGPAQRDRERQQRDEASERERAPRLGRLRAVPNAGPCPFVKVLYDAARYVELDQGRAAASAVGYTGEIEGVTAACAYQSNDPITVQANILFNLGRGPQAGDDRRTYRYWVAVTERNQAVLAKEYFDLPVDFDGQRTASVEQAQTVVIPRATAETSGGNFEVLIGFDVTPEMADFNRSGSRFRINAGAASAATSSAE
jgi:hypothetical protein